MVVTRPRIKLGHIPSIHVYGAVHFDEGEHCKYGVIGKANIVR